MLIADLSLDFDFFVRELEEWGFDCDETEHHATTIWAERYQAVDLRRETAIALHADFVPERLLEALEEKGIRLLENRKQCRVAIADSHAHAFSFFRSALYAPDLLLNLDAHHDCFDVGPELHCGNWATRLQGLYPAMRYLQVYPSWKNPLEDAESATPIEMVRWNEWAGFDPSLEVRVRHLFLCRSAGWVPPHHDAHFLALAEYLEDYGRPRWLEAVRERQAPWIPAEAAALR